MRRIIGVLLAVALAVAGFWVVEGRIDAALARRVAAGVPVTAEVTEVNFSFLPRGYRSVDVRFAFDGRTRTGTLGSSASELRGLAEGDRVEVFVDPTAPGRFATRDGGASEGLLLVLPGLALLVAIVAAGATAAVRSDGLGRVSRRALPRSPAGGTVYRATRLLTVAPAVVVLFSLAVAVTSGPVGWALALAGIGGAGWYLHTVVLGTIVVVRGGTLVVHDPSRRTVVPLAEVEAIAHTAGGTVVRTRDGATVPVGAARQRDPADARRQAERIVALADAQPHRAAGPVIGGPNWRYLTIQVATVGALAGGLGALAWLWSSGR
ncbi:MAG TPA: DUF3592 domain-containing protein [Asanoa sp.]|nr:DUF3592 domain-containing protein [Asanoa sp.]